MKAESPILPDWRWGTAEGCRELDRILDRRLTLREKIQWLEEAEDLTLTLAAQRARMKEAAAAKGKPLDKA
ncbi:hypothetical protein [Haloferula sp.]|uniref:hypothetical protein n=1 Tax=Haloferula sp. TaxID=2497595 RepID=UPI003C7722E5